MQLKARFGPNEPKFEFGALLPCNPRIARVWPDGTDVSVGVAMARAGLAYAAMLAASVSAGAPRHAGIRAYRPDEPASFVASGAPPGVPPVRGAAPPSPPGLAAPLPP